MCQIQSTKSKAQLILIAIKEPLIWDVSRNVLEPPTPQSDHR